MSETSAAASEIVPEGDTVFNVLMVGVGGQGIILASDILAEAAMLAGLDAKKSEVHGMSQRGGPVFSHVRFGRAVHSPVIGRGEADVLYSLERMELLRWAAWARPSRRQWGWWPPPPGCSEGCPTRQLWASTC